MGDLIDDKRMVNKLHTGHDDDLLSVGFFNNPDKDGEELLKEYEKHFDLVVMNDGNLHFLDYFVRMIGAQEGKCNRPSNNGLLAKYKDLHESGDVHRHFATKTHKINELFTL